MRLLSDVHLVGSGDSGFSLTEAFDCHVYLIDGGGAAALVDAGCGRSVDDILANIDAAGIALADLAYLVLTHAHPDHSAGAAGIKELLPHVTVAASAQVAAWVSHGDEEAMSLESGKRAEFYPLDLRFPPCPVERELSDGERFEVGRVTLEVLATPGHADGHLCLLAETRDGRVLFSGDHVFFGGRISLENNWDCRLQAYAASMRRLADADVDALLPGHHSISLKAGQRHIDSANRRLQNGFVPPSLV